MKQLEGKTVVVTGAGQGLGRATAIALSENGARVALLGRTLNKVEATVQKMHGSGLAVETDLQNSDSVRAAFARVRDEFGGFDALINNAATYDIFKIESATDEQLKNSLDTNLLGPMMCIREAIPSMREQGGGDIINITTESVRSPIPYLTHYAASKGGLEVLSRGLREELRPDKIRVTILRLGSIADPEKTVLQWDPKIAEEFWKAFAASGHNKWVGAGMSLATVANNILQVLALPQEANVDLLELRSI